MERLMELAKKAAEKVEVYSRETRADSVSFEDGRLKDIDSKLQCGVRLTLLAGGRMGSAYTRNLIDREGLVANALASLAAGAEADYELPEPRDLPVLGSYDPAIEALSNARMTDECARACDHLSGAVKGQVNAAADRTTTTVRVLTSRGADLSATFSGYTGYAAALFPGSYASVYRAVSAKRFTPLGDDDLQYIVSTYNAAQREARPKGGPTRVLFLPGTLYALLWRLAAATNAKSVYDKVSPVLDKRGERLFSDLLTVTDEPLDDTRPGARAFDDEGTACRTLPIVEEGVLRSFYCDRFYAARLGCEPTGHGYRDDIESKVIPSAAHLRVSPGAASLAQLLKTMGTGVVVSDVLGAHSGNIVNGDFSVGLSPGFAVENGEITGHVKDAMVAGNIYEVFRNVIAVGSDVQPGHAGWFPAVLFENVSVASRG